MSGVVKSWVYCIGPADGTFVKIGKAESVEKRLKCLQTGNRQKLLVHYAIPGAEPEESALHWLFAALQHSIGNECEGEWFWNEEGKITDWFAERVAMLERLRANGPVSRDLVYVSHKARRSDQTEPEPEPTIKLPEAKQCSKSVKPGGPVSREEIAEFRTVVLSSEPIAASSMKALAAKLNKPAPRLKTILSRATDIKFEYAPAFCGMALATTRWHEEDSVRADDVARKFKLKMKNDPTYAARFADAISAVTSAT